MVKKDFFISYNKADQPWAEWIAWELEEDGYSVIIQAWDFLVGDNFVIRMQEAASQAGRTVAVLSPDFLAAKFTQPEWAAAFRQDPTGADGLLLPIRVRPCDFVGLLPQIVYVDLVGKNADEARAALLRGATRKRNKPAAAPAFPPDIPSTPDGAVGAPNHFDAAQQLASNPKGACSLGISGIWNARFSYVDGQLYEEYIELQEDDSGQFIGRITPSWDNCPHTALVDHSRPLRLRGTVGSTSFLTGIWYQSARSYQQGAFQLQISSESDCLLGGWLKFSESRNDIVSGRWNWVRAGPRLEPVVGIYGVSGAGKTTLCRELFSRGKGCRFFSESDVLAKYMVEVRRSSFDEFRALSERRRMETREAAFSLHHERMKNSRGLVFGDAHYAFPRIRLGRIEHDHPDAEHGIQPVMPDAAWTLYKAIVYLDTPAGIVRARLNGQAVSLPRSYWAKDLSTAEIEQWCQYEKRKLARECASRGLTFIPISGDGRPSELADRVLHLVDQI